ncbi:MAG: cytochrome c, partial [Planctomycetes bacterium]|nr:cytochrome c [Planctomycetota bacterium]
MFRLITVICLLPLLFAGCQPPQAKQFVDGNRADQLHPQAVAELRAAVNERFGTPAALVASLELPVHFGRIEGEVVESSAGSHKLTVILKTDAVSAGKIKGLGFVWTSGAYTDAVYDLKKDDKKSGLKKGDEVVADFRVAGFEPFDGGAEGTLSLNFKLQDAAQAGDSFVIIGNRLRNGQQLYLQHCMHCHGYSGDGNGPTAKSLNPLPRDFRLGTFKFKATLLNDKPRRQDLVTTVKNGIPGTYMPSFLLLDEKERDTIIEYVRWLSMRGEFEKLLIEDLIGREFTKTNWSSKVEEGELKYKNELKGWQKNPRGRQPQRDRYGPRRYFRNGFAKWIDTAMKIVADEWSAVDKAHDPNADLVVHSAEH